MWTQSLEQIMIIRDETDLEESQIIVEDNPSRTDPGWWDVGLASPTYKSVGPWGPPSSPSFECQFATTFKIQSTSLLKVGSYRELKFDIAMDSWAHRTPSALYKRTPYLLQKGSSSSSLGSEVSNQEKNSPPC
jgi:hypothetical protein